MEVVIESKIIKVNIIRKNNKNIYFRFDENLNLVVTAPKRISDKKIKDMINENNKSLANMYKRVVKKNEKNKEFWYLGNKYDIIYNKNIKEIEFQDSYIYVKDELMLNKFLKKQIIDIFCDEVNKLKSIIKTPNFTLKFRKMKTRWGVCNYKLNIITLNTELIRYSKENLRYVIVHEMCHFYHHNHSKLFWKMVSEYYPNYKIARKELKY